MRITLFVWACALFGVSLKPAFAADFTSFTLDQRITIFKFLATGELGPSNGMMISRATFPDDPKMTEVIFKTGEHTVRVPEPRFGLSFSTLGGHRAEEREPMSAEALDGLFGAVEGRGPTDIPDSERVEIAHRVFKIVERAEADESRDPGRLRSAASYGLFHNLARLYYRTGDSQTLRLVSWLLVRNPEIRDWVMHSPAAHSSFLEYSFENYAHAMPGMNALTKHRREANFGLALVNGLFFDPLGWRPDSYAEDFSSGQRDLVALTTVDSIGSFLESVDQSFKFLENYEPATGIASTYQVLRPLLHDFFMLSYDPSLPHQRIYALLPKISQFREIGIQIHRALADDAYFQAEIAAPGGITNPRIGCGLAL